MKANELMIGDWVYAIDGDRKKHPCRIATLEYDSTNKRDDFSIDFYGTDYEVEWPDVAFEVEPIPLTPEILEKNGFKNVSVVIIGTRKMRWVSDDTRTEITIWMDDTLPMEIVKNVYYEDEVSYTLPFPGTVSQLQHALRLCGIDKEIML